MFRMKYNSDNLDNTIVDRMTVLDEASPKSQNRLKRNYLVSKVDLSKDEERRTLIEEHFSDPSKYLQINESEMIIGNYYTKIYPKTPTLRQKI